MIVLLDRVQHLMAHVFTPTVAPNHGYSSIAYLSSKLSTIIHQMLAPAAPEGIPIRSFLAAYKVNLLLATTVTKNTNHSHICRSIQEKIWI